MSPRCPPESSRELSWESPWNQPWNPVCSVYACIYGEMPCIWPVSSRLGSRVTSRPPGRDVIRMTCACMRMYAHDMRIPAEPGTQDLLLHPSGWMQVKYTVFRRINPAPAGKDLI